MYSIIYSLGQTVLPYQAIAEPSVDKVDQEMVLDKRVEGSLMNKRRMWGRPPRHDFEKRNGRKILRIKATSSSLLSSLSSS
jgi:hypothetical protein